MSVGALAPEAASAPREAESADRPRRRRLPLAAKLAIALIGLVTLVLLINGAVNLWLNYEEAKRAAIGVQQEKAQAAAERVDAFISDVENQIGWTTRAEWRRVPLEQQRYDFIRLLRQAPAITEVSYIDPTGKEQLKVSRLEPDTVGSGKDFSAEPRFKQAVAEKVWLGPVYFRRGSEPYMTVAVAHAGRNPGVTAAEVNLKLVWDVITAIKVGEKGFAFVVTSAGRLIAHPDLSLVLRDTDLSRVPQVARALTPTGRSASAGAAPVAAPELATDLAGNPVLSAHAPIRRVGWLVFVQSPVSEALAPVYRSLMQTAALLGLGLLLATVAGTFLSRRMVVPIRRLQEGAERLGSGDLSQRIAIRTGDEIETLADRFNVMASRIQESHETLEGKVEERTRDLNETLQQQTATAEVLQVISRSAFDLEQILRTLAQSAAQLGGGKRCGIFFLEGDLLKLKSNFGYTSEHQARLLENPLRVGAGNLVGRAVHSDGIIHVPDVFLDADFQNHEGRKVANLRAFLGVPLKRDGKVFGVLGMNRPEPGPFSERQIQLVQTFADQAVIAIENARLFEEVQARTRELTESLQQQTATAEVLKVISRSTFDLKAVLTTLVQSARELCDAPQGMVLLRDGDVYRTEMQLGYPPEFEAYILSHPILPNPYSGAGKAAFTGQVAHFPDVLANPEYRLSEGQRLGGYRALLSIPLLREEEVVGVFSLGRPEPKPFTERQIELVKTFADQAVIAIENGRLFGEVQARTAELSESLQQQTATAQVLQVISRSAFDLQTVLDTLTNSAVALCEADHGVIVRRDGEVYRLASSVGFSAEFVAFVSANPLPLDVGGTIGRAAASGGTAHVPDVLAEPGYRATEFQKLGGYRTNLAVPLMRGGVTSGVFLLTRGTVNPFTAKQIELVETFADQALIAIENARLFEEVQARTREVQQSLDYQTATAEILAVISKSPTDTQPVFDAIAERAGRLSEAPFCNVTLFDGEMIRIVALHHSDPAFRSRFAELFPRRLDGVMPSSLTISTGQSVYVRDATEDPRYRDLAVAGGWRSIFAVPILRKGRAVGTIAAAKAEPGGFNDRQIKLLTTFADQAVIAIENARLFEEVQARTRELSESLTQQTATADVLKVISRSAFDLQAVLDTLVESAARLCESDKGVIFKRDGDAYRWSANYGNPPELETFAKANPFKPGRYAVTGRVALEGRTIHVPDVLADPEYGASAYQKLGGYRTILGVPLLREGTPMGVFALTRDEVRPFTDKQIELVQTFADQAVIAIENARLFDEVQARTRELQQSLDDLKKAQDRLIQSEKLASLGQLTAGIAHEIKNPLNFVNNFSSLSADLIDELREVLEPAPLDNKIRDEVEDLTGMLKGNLEKVVQHGKRADSIVKNMLLHSREGSGEHRPVDVNALVEESMNLAYHGARAEKPGFNVTLAKELDPAAGEVDLYPQEITRVLLNLIGNGFYAATKRKAEVDGAFEPTMTAATRNLGDKVEIRIRDNGTGIPDEVRAKMFNPFFTTKPAGEGTGLGLSLSHDIIVKQHGGSIEVATEPGQFTEFTIVLPRGGLSTLQQSGS